MAKINTAPVAGDVHMECGEHGAPAAHAEAKQENARKNKLHANTHSNNDLNYFFFFINAVW